MNARQPARFAIVGLVLFIALAWGTGWPVMKIVMAEMAPMHMRSFCLLIGSAVLLAYARASGQRVRIPAGSRLRLAYIGLANYGAFNILAVYGITLIGAARASILCYTFPVWTALLGRWFLNEQLTPRRLLGVVLGLLAVLLLLGNDVRSLGRSPLGATMLIVVAIGWAASLIMMRKWSIDLPTSSFTAWQTLITVVPVGSIALLFERGSFSPLGLSTWPFWGLMYLVCSSILSTWAWTKLALTVPPAVSSLSMLLTPVVAVFASAMLTDDQPQWIDYVALTLVVSAMATVLLSSRKRGPA